MPISWNFISREFLLTASSSRFASCLRSSGKMCMKSAPVVTQTLLGCIMLACCDTTLAKEPRVDRGTAKFVAIDPEKCPAPFRLDDHAFDYQVQWRDVDSPRFEL